MVRCTSESASPSASLASSPNSISAARKSFNASMEWTLARSLIAAFGPIWVHAKAQRREEEEEEQKIDQVRAHFDLGLHQFRPTFAPLRLCVKPFFLLSALLEILFHPLRLAHQERNVLVGGLGEAGQHLHGLLEFLDEFVVLL